MNEAGSASFVSEAFFSFVKDGKGDTILLKFSNLIMPYYGFGFRVGFWSTVLVGIYLYVPIQSNLIQPND